ncbi:relaxase/mobilization nuclease domain-containing protein [Streptosporangium canum]|uniref:relaxase/mobilization nuclease domain-containing protein n=1 Tax=Streptosporangium canum TaxID=324952 RepID=UPI00342915F5
MIAKIASAHGRDVAGLVRYLFGRGRSDEHRDQRVIAADEQLEIADGTRLDSPADWPRVLELGCALDDHRLAAGIEPAGGWVWHCALALAPDERLTDGQWAEAARAVVARLGFDGSDGRAPCRWIAVHHGPFSGGNDHIHLAVNLVRGDLRLARPGRDRIAMSKLCGELERRFGLRVVDGRARRGLPGISRAEIERARRAGPTAQPERIVLARHVRAAAMAASTEAEFVRRLKGAGVWGRPRYGVGGTTEVVGYCVALPPQQGRKAIWFGGGKMAADLTLPKLRANWRPGGAGEALAEWSAESVRVTALGRGELPIEDPGAWSQAAQLVDGARQALITLPPDDPRWTVACRGAAAMMAVLALRIETERPGALSAAADRLAWSAQDPAFSPGQAGLAGQQMRRDVGAAVRIISQAARARRWRPAGWSSSSPPPCWPRRSPSCTSGADKPIRPKPWPTGSRPWPASSLRTPRGSGAPTDACPSSAWSTWPPRWRPTSTGWPARSSAAST